MAAKKKPAKKAAKKPAKKAATKKPARKPAAKPARKPGPAKAKPRTPKKPPQFREVYQAASEHPELRTIPEVRAYLAGVADGRRKGRR